MYAIILVLALIKVKHRLINVSFYPSPPPLAVAVKTGGNTVFECITGGSPYNRH